MTTGTLKQKMPIAVAIEKAKQIGRLLKPSCQRIAIAGSIRRSKPEVGDIELVCIPIDKMNLLGEKIGTELADVLDKTVHDGILCVPTKNGEKQKQFPLPGGGCVDLFIVNRDNWGMQYAIRTGPEAFSKALVTQRKLEGWDFNPGMAFRDSLELSLAGSVNKSSHSARLLAGTKGKMRVLLGLHLLGGSARQRQICRLIGRNKATVSTIITSLADAGMVEHDPACYGCSITARGVALLRSQTPLTA